MNGASKRKECLVIGPYGEDNSKEREWSTWLLEKIVKPVVEEEFDYKAHRTIDDPQPGQIPKRIVHSLRNADLVVADLTGANPNVYYELALRHAKSKPFIHVAREDTKIPFDINVMEAIKVARGDKEEAWAQNQLRKQLKNVEQGNVIFETDASEPQPRLQAQAYDWEIAYALDVADKWLENQDQPVKEAVETYNSHGGVPPIERLKNSLLEYLAYRLSHGTIYNVDLYYVLDTRDWHFEGWGVAPPTTARKQLTLQVTGDEDRKSGSIELRFDQPPMHQVIAGLEGDLGPYQYAVLLKASERKPGVLEGEFRHPQFPSIRVGKCVLRQRTG